MTNRCDSVDALMYAYYEMMRMKETNQMLEKNKDYIELSMHSMMATHKPYQEDTEIAIEGMAPGKSLLSANYPFDIPCDVVVVSKSYFEALQTENEELKKKLEEFSWQEATGCSTPEEAKELIDGKKRRIIELNDELDDSLSANEELKKKLHEYDPISDFKEVLKKVYSINDVENLEWALNHVCGGRGSVNGWIAVIKTYSRALKDWKEVTGCPSPAAAKTLIESGISWHHAYRDVKVENEKLTDDVKSWKNVTGYSIPEDYMHARISGAFHTPFDYTATWQKATGCDTPEEAEKMFKSFLLTTRLF